MQIKQPDRRRALGGLIASSMLLGLGKESLPEIKTRVLKISEVLSM